MLLSLNNGKYYLTSEPRVFRPYGICNRSHQLTVASLRLAGLVLYSLLAIM